MRLSARWLTVCIALFVHSVAPTTTAQSKPKASAVGAKVVTQVTDGVSLTARFDLRKVKNLLADVRATLSTSPAARERLYYKVGQPADDYVRFKHLEKLANALSQHAVQAAQSQDLGRTHLALDLAVETMLLIATSPAPPSRLQLGTQTLPGGAAAGEPVWALRSSLFNFCTALKSIMESQPKALSALQPIWLRCTITELTIAEASTQQRLKQLANQGRYREFAQECLQIRGKVAKDLSALRKELGVAFQKLR